MSCQSKHTETDKDDDHSRILKPYHDSLMSVSQPFSKRQI